MLTDLKKKQLLGLGGSIIKWMRIVEGKSGDRGSDNCPLCFEFLSYRPNRNFCQDCPIFEKRGVFGCDRTPYTAWHQYCQFSNERAYLLKKKFKAWYVVDLTSYRLAKEELEFLRRLYIGLISDLSLSEFVELAQGTVEIYGQYLDNLGSVVSRRDIA
jgi:hypothetical protein